VRNTLAKRALKDYPVMSEAVSGSFKGTNAFVFAYGAAAVAAKWEWDWNANGLADNLEGKA
jgi:ribosomal protein L10